MADKQHTPTLDDLPRARVVVVGDMIADVWIHGTVDRISPEAPVPVFLEEHRTEAQGGASNVHANLAALGLSGYGNALFGGNGPPPLKHRFIVNGQQIFRHDIEEVEEISLLLQNDIVNQVAGFHSAGCLILSDYGKGTLTTSLCHRLIQWAKGHNIPVVVDPKGKHWSKYAGATVITPNEAELRAVASEPFGGWSVLVTRGDRGMSLLRKGAAEINIPAQAKEVFDVTGAGDTVVAVLGACLAVGFDMEQAARVANAAAGVVVGKRGTATCSLDELKQVYRPKTKVVWDTHVSDAFTLKDIPVNVDEPIQIVVEDVNTLRTPTGIASAQEYARIVGRGTTVRGVTLLPTDQEYWTAMVYDVLAKKPKTRAVDHWDKGWKENYEAFVKTGNVEELYPKYWRDGPVRWQGKFWMPATPDAEAKWYASFFEDIAHKWMQDSKVIYEFGSGSGHNLVRLARLYPMTHIFGADWSKYAVMIANAIPGNISGLEFDLLNPRHDWALTDATVLTVGAMEQTGKLWRPFLNYLLKNKPRRVVHIEPIREWYDSANPVDKSAVDAHEARGFWTGYVAALLDLAEEGKVEFEHTDRTGFGSLLIEGYSQLIWRPL